MRRLSRYADTTIPMYDDDQDFDLQVRVRRMTRREKIEFNYGLLQTSSTDSERMIERRDDEMARHGGQFIIPDATIQARRLSEMTPEQRTEYKALVRSEEDAAEKFLVESIRAYLEIEPGQLEYETDDGESRELRTGEDLLAAYGGNEAVLREAINVIRRENTLTHAEKKRLQQLRGFGSGSATRPEPATGTAPETAATGAERKDSVGSETAPAETKTNPSGSPVH